MKRIQFALLDQVLISGSNFALSLALARFLSEQEYGLYIFGLTTLTVLIGLASSTIFSSLSVLCAPLIGAKWQSYVKGHAILFILLILFIILCLSSCGVWLLNGKFADNGQMLLVIAVILFFYIGHEFGRVVLLCRLQTKEVLLGDFICYGSRILLVLGAVQIGVKHGWQLILIFGLSSVLGVLYFWRLANMHRVIFLNVVQRQVYSDIVHYSRWTFAEWIPFVLSGQLYVYVVTFALGNEANGALGACRNLVMPVIVFLVGVMNYSLPYYSKIFVNQGDAQLLNGLKKYFVLLVTIAFVYLFFLHYFRFEILNIIYNKYFEFNFLVPLFALGLMANVLFNPAEIYFRVTRNTKFLFFARLVSAIVTMVTCYPLISYFGVKGAVFSYILSQFTMGFTLYILIILRKFRKMKESVGQCIYKGSS